MRFGKGDEVKGRMGLGKCENAGLSGGSVPDGVAGWEKMCMWL